MTQAAHDPLDGSEFAAWLRQVMDTLKFAWVIVPGLAGSSVSSSV